MRSGAAGAYTITYVRYAPNDPMCCPSRRPLTIHYGWSGHILISDGAPPKYGKPGVQVMLLKH